ncbi:Ger(x)C family spore germination protein [Orenia marismortui]|uniref:Ger(X)C family germination protein n=1 Tax=Orenia marismortui TaxID=46469 RepID=A0A4R8GWH3_9FIRM|nr:Ger(x)C family spore germination protein [Orenia marismortui]TDX48034.1 Ger(x)C family germination protein [Orenia marismortui]
MRSVKLILVFMILILLTGCFNRVELEEMAYVVVIGLDKGEAGGFEVTYQIGNPQVGSSDRVQAEGEPPSEIVTLTAPDITTARDLANISVSREVTYAHLKVLVTGEKLTRSGEAFTLLDSVLRDEAIKQEVMLIVSKEKASEFIRGNKHKLETRPHKHYEFMARRWKETGLVPDATLLRFFPRTLGDAGLFLSTYATSKKGKSKYGYEDEYLAGQVKKEGGNPIQMIGSAVLKEGKMIGTLTGEETKLSLLLRPHTVRNSILASYSDPLAKEKRIAARWMKTKDTQIEMDLSTDTPKIDVIVPLKFEILSIASGIDYIENLEKQKILKDSIASSLEDKAKQLVNRTQQEFKGDPFQWYLIARKEFWTLDEYIKYNWMKSYPRAEVNIRFDIKIVNFGR